MLLPLLGGALRSLSLPVTIRAALKRRSAAISTIMPSAAALQGWSNPICSMPAAASLSPASPTCTSMTPSHAFSTSAAIRSPESSLMSVVTSALSSNQFASGGLVLMAAGVAAAGAKTAFDYIWEYMKRRLFVRMEVDSRDDAYRWVMAWLSQHPEFGRSPRVSVHTSLQAFGTSGLEGSLLGSNKMMLMPAPGDHMLRHGHHWIWISRQRQPGGQMMNYNARLLPETLVLTCWGADRSVLENLLATCATAYEADTRQRTVIHSMDADGYWARVGSRPIRPLNTVVLPGNQAEELLADCQEFLSSEAWYSHHGIPYRRGYLLHGIAGSGKTSLVTALAGALALDVYVVTLSSPAMTDEKLRSLLNSAADRCVLLLEDVDAAFVGREGQAVSSLTFSGLLNAIDGVAAQEGRLLFMTTNHVERLSSALIRPGRVDVRYFFGYATMEQASRLFVSFYKHLPVGAPTQGRGTSWSSTAVNSTLQGPTDSSAHEAVVQQLQGIDDRVHASVQGPLVQMHDISQLAERFARHIPERRVSMASLQGYLMRNKHDAQAALAGVDAWLATLPKTSSGADLDVALDMALSAELRPTAYRSNAIVDT